MLNLIQNRLKSKGIEHVEYSIDITDIPELTLNQLNTWCEEHGATIEVNKGRVLVPIMSVKS